MEILFIPGQLCPHLLFLMLTACLFLCCFVRLLVVLYFIYFHILYCWFTWLFFMFMVWTAQGGHGCQNGTVHKSNKIINIRFMLLLEKKGHPIWMKSSDYSVVHVVTLAKTALPSVRKYSTFRPFSTSKQKVPAVILQGTCHASRRERSCFKMGEVLTCT